jgi:glycerol-3-phosphate dehydrogenase
MEASRDRGCPAPHTPALQGMRVRPEGPQLISELVRKELGVDCSVLMGANIALDIARGELSEATIGYNVRDNARVLRVSQPSPSRRSRARGGVHAAG